MEKQVITVEIFVNAPVEAVWHYWTEPRHIMQWNQPSDEWTNSRVENDLRVGGRFLFMMEAKDGSAGFAFEGVYDAIQGHHSISYTLMDGRKTVNVFAAVGAGTTITETFEPTAGLPEQEQRIFCTGVLEKFKAYVENQQ
ncbi:SRPBCC domain-containing protein [Paraflavitalea speifideaquila]|uniref:SRPBCC domain-containing protein n=1 Tax=Paraflavitalea speifideaquila TaxID=3076558 RepID=UPI0028EBCE3C|nr:SRPBCC domain-containing protein [Paraflavitalea speifideiaquila]